MLIEAEVSIMFILGGACSKFPYLFPLIVNYRLEQSLVVCMCIMYAFTIFNQSLNVLIQM